jgi:putative phage-type endonuclease
MNKQNLIFTSVKEMDRAQWLQFRYPLTHVNRLLAEHKIKTYGAAEKFFESAIWESFIFPCVGGSEIASVMGLNPYKSVIEMFYEKIGIHEVADWDKEIMFWGRELEEQIADKWQYWEHLSEENEVDRMIDNYKKKKIVRRCRRVNAYIQNKKFPFIFVSLDRIINQTGTKKEGALECKTISQWAAKSWESGLPPMYVVQNQCQLHTCTMDFGEIAILKDGREFDVLPFEYSPKIGAAIEMKCRRFFEKVKVGIQHFVLSRLTSVEAIKNMHLHEVDMLSPDADGSESYKNYLNTKYTDKGFSKKGGAIEYELAVKHENCTEQVKSLTKEKLLYSNQLKQFMQEASELTFGEDGKVTWAKKGKPKKDGSFSRTFKVSLVKRKKST